MEGGRDGGRERGREGEREGGREGGKSFLHPQYVCAIIQTEVPSSADKTTVICEATEHGIKCCMCKMLR